VGIAGFEKVQALKRIVPELAHDPAFRRAFVDEAKIAVTLNHRNIVQVFELGEHEGELLAAMELIEGVSLREGLAEARAHHLPLPLPLACYLMSEVAAGLEYAHRRADESGKPLGVVHGGLSPAKIQLSFEGYVKILDFGVARAAFAARDPARRPVDPRYLAPELLTGSPPSPAADVYALGAVAWELLTGSPPAVEVAGLPAQVPDFLTKALLSALAPDAAARGPAVDLGAALSRALRTIDPGAGSRALARWLAELYPPPAPPPLAREDSTKPLKPMNHAARLEHLPPPPPAPRPRPPTPLPIDGGLAGLGEKRRVVAAACRLERGSDENQRAVRRLLADLAYKLGAVVQADEPGWLVAIFGLEQASEDDLSHAARFALDAHEAVRDARGASDEPAVALHIGIGHGLVAPRRGSEGGSETSARRHDYRLLGGAVDEARALALVADPGQTLIAGDPSRLAAQHWEFRERGTHRRGSRRARRYELVGQRVSPRGRVLDLTSEGPLRGRRAELAQLVDAWALARREDRRVTVAVVGEAGIGKSRLVAELIDLVTGERPFYVHIGGTPGGREQPYALALQQMSSGLRLPPTRGAAARQRFCDALTRILREIAAPADVVDEVLATVELALELRDGAAPGESVMGAHLPRRMAAAIATLRRLLPRSRGRLCVIEDCHWADAASAEIMRLTLLSRPPSGAELLILTSRPPEGLRADDPAVLPAGVERTIELGELSAEERVDFLRDRLGPDVTDAALGLCERRAGGNPLFLAELAAALGDLGANDLPENARAVIAARVDRLPAAAKAALQHAAVLGPAFDPTLLEALLGVGVRDALAELIARGLLVFDDENGALAFRHGLLQEVVYDAIAGAARAGVHRRVALLLSGEGEAENGLGVSTSHETPQTIARHFERGGEPERAAVYHVRAGRLALAAFDAREAVAAFTHALELAHASPGAIDPTFERQALSGREQAYFRLGEHEAQRHDLDALTSLSTDEPRRLADVRCRAAARHLRLGELDAAVAASISAERSAERAGDLRARGEALRLRAEAYERQADFSPALDAVTRALAMFRHVESAADESRALMGQGRIHVMCARYDAALACYAPALEHVRAVGDAWAERMLRHHLAVVHRNRKDFCVAMKDALRSLDLCRRLGDRAREGDDCTLVGTIYLSLGCYDEAREWSAHGLAIHAETGSRWSRADALVYAAHLESLVGDPALGLRWLDEAIGLALDIGARHVLANARNQLAFALVKRRGAGDLERAEREARAAALLGRDATLPTVEIQGHTRAAQARLELGDAAGALAESSQAVDRLAEVRCIEWSEEEVWVTHHRVLLALGDAAAADFLQRARVSLAEKLERLTEPRWRTAYAAIELHRKIFADG
jgi:serine/threonine protein kinase/tetratricopeptide (TPR) repeat protein